MLPLNLGIRAHDIEAHSREELVSKLHGYNFSHIQFAIKKSFPEAAPELQSISSGTASYFGDYFQNEQIKISVLGCYINLSSPNRIVKEKAIADFKHHVTLAKDFHSALVGTETGSVGNGYTEANFTEEAYQVALKSIVEMVSYAEKFGVTVGIEAGLNHPIYTSTLAKKLISDVKSPNLKIILDCANLMRPDNFQNQEQVIAQAFEDLHGHISCLHLKDFIFEDGKIKIVTVGQGLMDYSKILSYLKYERPLMFASLEATTEPHIKPAIDMLNKIYNEV